jgi:hypothetical protein
MVRNRCATASSATARGLEVTLHRILVHVLAETSRHAGQAGIVREFIDGAAGLQADDDNLRAHDPQWWRDYRSQLEQVAQQASQR